MDHIITNIKERVSRKDVLLCPTISDHNVPLISVNTKVAWHEPRHKIKVLQNFIGFTFFNNYNSWRPKALITHINDLLLFAINENAKCQSPRKLKNMVFKPENTLSYSFKIHKISIDETKKIIKNCT